MAEVVATERGYFGGKIIEPGEPFTVDDELWADLDNRPKWAVEAVVAPLAAQDDASASTATPKPRKGKAADAPAGNGLQAALGGVAPDWIDPSTGQPMPSADAPKAVAE